MSDDTAGSTEAIEPPVADGVEHHLDPRSVSVHRIGGWIFSGIVIAGTGLGLAATAIFSPMPIWLKAALLLVAWPALAALMGWLAHGWPAVEHRHASYRVDDQGIEIKRGVVWRSVVSVPRNRVQHTDVSQGPIERWFGLGTLVIFTAGTEHARVTLGGLDHARALKIRDHLLASEGADAV
jgi:membrane protein YdbS with pleckstrin-like domain